LSNSTTADQCLALGSGRVEMNRPGGRRRQLQPFVGWRCSGVRQQPRTFHLPFAEADLFF
jgi:hypothetical protein